MIFPVITTPANTFTLTSVGQSDIFVAKIKGDGSDWLWAIRAGGDFSDAVFFSKIAVDHDNNLVIAGDFKNTATFGATTLTANGNITMFIAKIVNNSPIVAPSLVNWLWAAQAKNSSGGFSYGPVCAVDNDNNYCIAGDFSGTITFGLTKLVSPSVNTSITHAYIAKIRNDGSSWIGAIMASTPNATTINESVGVSALAIDADNNCLVGGAYGATTTFGPNISLTNPNLGIVSVFTAKAAITAVDRKLIGLLKKPCTANNGDTVEVVFDEILELGSQSPFIPLATSQEYIIDTNGADEPYFYIAPVSINTVPTTTNYIGTALSSNKLYITR
jgi:hypothetical protein